MTAADPRLSVVVVSWNTREILRGCLASIERHLSSLPCETIVVDNASADGSAEMVEQDFPRVRLIRHTANLGFGAGCNAGMKEARADALLLLNSDARLTDGSLVRLLDVMTERPDVGIAGPRIRFESGQLQATAHRFASLARLFVEESGLYKLLPRARASSMLLGGYWDHGEERAVDWLTGACLLVRRAVFEQTGGFDARIFLYGEEVEWCYRVRQAGWTILYAPVSEVVHIGHASADRLVGSQGRVDLCLLAADDFTRQREGPLAGMLAGLIRASGAVLRMVYFQGRRVFKHDQYGRDVVRESSMVLNHYVRRGLGRVPRA
jgi:GT2 family glycosyltransferase